MQITAQGYARLADKLKADIAVLEGGYSIESAFALCKYRHYFGYGRS